ncbi:peptidylglycine alpha-hydroxylating monooxygenase-like isoform X1 [Branchiostoma floridae x Branchiostoma belcheri]
MIVRSKMAGCYFALLLLAAHVCWTLEDGMFTKTLRMPGASPEHPEALICHAVKMEDDPTYIVGYEPHASGEIAHHMMLYGCEKPGSTDEMWNCEETRGGGRVCADGEGQDSRQVVYAWALDAPALYMPEDVGFRVGGTTRIKYIVLQLHYKNKLPAGTKDNSGVTLHMQRKQPKFQAGFYVLGTWGSIPPHVEDYHMETACEYTDPSPMYPIAYRTHSHSLGVVTSGYRIRNNQWTEIGRMSPQRPQMFYNATTPGMSVLQGDVLAVRCTMTSDRDTVTKIGETNADEMCNFYIMYYTGRTDDLTVRWCFQNNYHWEEHFSGIPDKASSLDGILPADDDVMDHHVHHHD